MQRRSFNLALGAVAAAPFITARAAAAPHWSLTADVAESCSCEIPCPCNFGRPTDLKCEGSRLIQITEGSIDGASLAGIGFVATFDMGNWARIYVDEKLGERQRAAFEAVFPLAFAGFHKLMQTRQYVPLTVSRSADTVRFEVPESTVEIRMMRGLHDAPIRINGLPSPVFHDYTQYESVVHEHHSEQADFSHRETNGFTSRMIVAV